MHAAFARADHRPWPLPAARWTWRQSWCDLLFAHWPIPAATLRPLVLPELEIQELDGTSWVGVVPFRMEGVMLRPLPDLPWLSAFPELNLRLYVERDGKPGVWFLSLDATNPLAIWAARRCFHLPYFGADMGLDEDERGQVLYRSVRRAQSAGLPARSSTGSPSATACTPARRAGALVPKNFPSWRRRGLAASLATRRRSLGGPWIAPAHSLARSTQRARGLQTGTLRGGGSLEGP